MTESSVTIPNLHYIAGSVVIYRADLEICIAAFIVIDIQDHSKLIYEKTIELQFSTSCTEEFYVIRETPIITQLYTDFCDSMPNIEIDALLISGTSENSLYGARLASSVGAEIEIPTIDIFPAFIFADSKYTAQHIEKSLIQNELKQIGNCKILKESRDNTEIQYAVVRTSYETENNGIILMPGYCISIEQSIEIIRCLTIFHLPEPIRLADMITRKYINENIDHKLTVVPEVPEEPEPQPEREQNQNRQPQAFHLIIALDCTGSMGPYISNIQKALSIFINIIKGDFPQVYISFYAIRDYCDKEVIRKECLMQDVERACFAFSREMANGGGDYPEAHKTGLATIYDDVSHNKDSMTNVCIFITDAPPHLNCSPSSDGNPGLECIALQKKQFHFALNWVDLARSLDSIGIQVFSFLGGNTLKDKISFAVLSELTHALCFSIPHDEEHFVKQMVSIINNLIHHDSATVVPGVTMLKVTSDISSLIDETELKSATFEEVHDAIEIKEALTEKAILLRLSPTERGAKRVIISSNELVERSSLTINALRALYAIIQGDSTQFLVLESNKLFTNIAQQLRDANPSPSWITDSTSSCILSMMSLADAFEELMSFDLELALAKRDIVSIFCQLGNFIIGYPFLFELPKNGKFNMQDAWPIFLKSVTTSYTLSLTSLFSMIEENKTPETDIVSQFKDLIDKSQRSGIVPLCPDVLTSFVIKILDVTKWLDALVSYGLHRHIEPLPSITRATCSAFINKLAYDSFPRNGFTEHEQKALHLILAALDAMESRGCNEMMKEFVSCIEKSELPFSAYAPQEPFNCSSINKILNCFFQLKPLIKAADRDYMIQFFNLGLSEALLLMQKFVVPEKLDRLCSTIFPPYKVDTSDVLEQNPLELDTPTAFTFEEFPFNIIEPNNGYKMQYFLMKTIWSMLRDDEFPELSPLLITTFLAELSVIKPRSFKYIKSGIDENDHDLYRIKPEFATLNPNELLRQISFIHYQKTYLDAILELQESRKDYLNKEIISSLVTCFRDLDLESFHRHLIEGITLHWMSEPYTLTMIHSGDVIQALISQVHKFDGTIDFYKDIILLLANGADSQKEHQWQYGLATYRDFDIIAQYCSQFCQGDEDFRDKLFSMNSRPTPNRHYHHKVFCRASDEYTPEYARARIICQIAPFYFNSSLPHSMNQINTRLIQTLSKKIGAPDYDIILNFAHEIWDEISSK